MSDNTKKVQNTENTNEWINWIEEAVECWWFLESVPCKLEKYSKTISVNHVIMKEIVFDFYNNIIRCHGIIKFESENQISYNYMMVVEYSDGDSLRNYLKENFNKLTWDDNTLWRTSWLALYHVYIMRRLSIVIW
ncbi:kinase-like domain-containing protein [Rhizophagus irregularis DAOM 181602=DAOM 197198]|nr:kinase-like domain-containing protein [Rhizophagus irregularis DAOM 181602=DAOM 197198]